MNMEPNISDNQQDSIPTAVTTNEVIENAKEENITDPYSTETRADQLQNKETDMEVECPLSDDEDEDEDDSVALEAYKTKGTFLYTDTGKVYCYIYIYTLCSLSLCRNISALMKNMLKLCSLMTSIMTM